MAIYNKDKWNEIDTDEIERQISKVRKQEREIAYCEDCGLTAPWLLVDFHGSCFFCGSTRYSRGTTGARGRIND